VICVTISILLLLKVFILSIAHVVMIKLEDLLRLLRSDSSIRYFVLIYSHYFNYMLFKALITIN